MVIDHMDSMKTTMYAGAFLAVAVLVMTVSLISEGLFPSETPETFGYEIASAEGTAPAAATGPAELPPIGPFLANADVESGATIFKKCASCHNDVEGGSNKIGPNLWDIIGRVPGAIEGFKYSSAMASFGPEHGPWDFEALNHFLLKPKDFIKGTSMGFAGLKDEQDRADIIAYLNQQSSDPKPLVSEETPAEAAPAPADTEMAPAANTDTPDTTAEPATDKTAEPATDTMTAPAEAAPSEPTPAPAQ